MVKRLNTNYAYAFILLAEHYERSGEDTRARHWRTRALYIAQPDPYLLKKLKSRTDN